MIGKEHKGPTGDEPVGQQIIGERGQQLTIEDLDRAQDEGREMRLEDLIKRVRRNCVASCAFYEERGAGCKYVIYEPNSKPRVRLVDSALNSAIFGGTGCKYDGGYVSPFGNQMVDSSPDRDVIFFGYLVDEIDDFAIDTRGLDPYYLTLSINSSAYHGRGVFKPHVDLVADCLTVNNIMGQLMEHPDRYYQFIRLLFSGETDQSFWRMLNRARVTNKLTFVKSDFFRKVFERFYDHRCLGEGFFKYMDEKYPEVTFTINDSNLPSDDDKK